MRHAPFKTCLEYAMNIEKIVAAFDFGAPVTAIRECRIGHINSTFFADCANGRFVVQRINRGIFKRPEEIMSNVVGVTTHIRKKLIAEGKDPDTGTLTFVKSGERYFHIDEEGEYWRAYRFVDGDCFNACDSAALFSRVGSAFGRFQRQLADYDAATLYEVIPDFHNTVKRYEAFEAAVAADAVDARRNVLRRSPSSAKDATCARSSLTDLPMADFRFVSPITIPSSITS